MKSAVATGQHCSGVGLISKEGPMAFQSRFSPSALLTIRHWVLIVDKLALKKRLLPGFSRWKIINHDVSSGIRLLTHYHLNKILLL